MSQGLVEGPAQLLSPVSAASVPAALEPPHARVSLAHAGARALLVGAAVALAVLDGRRGWLGEYSNAAPGLAYSSVWILLLSLGSAFIKATIGMAYGTTLVPILFILRLPPVVKEAVLLSQLLADISATFFHHQAGNFNLWKDHATRNAGLVLGGIGLVVAVAAEAVTINMPQHLLRIGITVVVIAMGVFMLVAGGLRVKLRMRNVGVLAGIAAFNKAFSGGGYGALVTGGQVLVGLPVRAAIATTLMAEAIVCTAAITTYYLHGKTIPAYLLLPMCAGAVLSTPASALTLRRLPVGLIKRIMAVAIIVLGVYALVQGKGI